MLSASLSTRASSFDRAAAFSLRAIAAAQAVFFAGLSLIAVGIFGIGLLFAAGDAPTSGAGRHEVLGFLAIVFVIVLVPCLLTTAFTAAAIVVGRRPRIAGVLALIADVVAATLLLWPSLHEWIFGLTPARTLALLELGLCVPGIVLAAVLALRSGDVHAAVSGDRGTGAAPSAGRRH